MWCKNRGARERKYIEKVDRNKKLKKIKSMAKR